MKVTLLPRKEFEIRLHDNVIMGQFGTWALKRFCDLRGYSLSDVAKAFTGEKAFDDMIVFLLCAVEYKCRLNNEDFFYTDVHVCEWIDEMGGIDSPEFAGLFNHANSDDSKKKAAKGK